MVCLLKAAVTKPIQHSNNLAAVLKAVSVVLKVAVADQFHLVQIALIVFAKLLLVLMVLLLKM